MNAAVRSTRQAEVDARLRTRIERLQRLIEAGLHLDIGEAGSAEARRPVCFPPAPVPPLATGPLKGPRAAHVGESWTADQHKPLLPFPGYPNAAIAHAVTDCIGLNLLGASEETRDNVLRELQAKLSETGRYTYVCLTDSTDFAYFIQRGVTFEYFGYLDRIGEPAWRRYFELNVALIKKKYGLAELVPAGDPRYAA
jgi:hypothetical protein